MGIDRRIKYTKKVIKDSFLQLLHEYPISEITVKTLCIDADINRATFYRHYDSVLCLLEEIEDEICAEANLVEIQDLTNIRVLNLIYNKQGFYKEFFRTNILSSLIKNSNKLFYEKELEKAKRNKNFNEKETKYAFDFYIYGIEGLLKNWVMNDCKETPDELSEILSNITLKK